MKFKMILFIISFILSYQCLVAANLDGTTGTCIYQSSQYAFSNGDFAKGFVCLNGGFSIGSTDFVILGVLQPVSGGIDLNGDGGFILSGDLTLGSGITLQNGGVIDGQGYTIFLNGDLTIPSGMGLEIISDTVIDGQGHEIIFEDGNPGGYFWINGANGTVLTLRNCIIKGLKDYSASARSIRFGNNDDQRLVLNDVILHLTDEYSFFGGFLDIENFVQVTGDYYFKFISEYECTIKSGATLFFDMRTTLFYEPNAEGSTRYFIVMEDESSRLFFNGCILYLPLGQGLVLKDGHLIIDHKTILQGEGQVCGYSYQGLWFGNGRSDDDLKIDFLPGADFQVFETTLHYDNFH